MGHKSWARSSLTRLRLLPQRPRAHCFQLSSARGKPAGAAGSHFTADPVGFRQEAPAALSAAARPTPRGGSELDERIPRGYFGFRRSRLFTTFAQATAPPVLSSAAAIDAAAIGFHCTKSAAIRRPAHEP